MQGKGKQLSKLHTSVHPQANGNQKELLDFLMEYTSHLNQRKIASTGHEQPDHHHVHPCDTRTPLTIQTPEPTEMCNPSLGVCRTNRPAANSWCCGTSLVRESSTSPVPSSSKKRRPSPSSAVDTRTPCLHRTEAHPPPQPPGVGSERGIILASVTEEAEERRIGVDMGGLPAAMRAGRGCRTASRRTRRRKKKRRRKRSRWRQRRRGAALRRRGPGRRP